MGLILDSSAVIAGERKGQTIAELLADLRAALGAEAIALATVSVIELEHGIWRALDAAQAERRRKFLDELFAAVPTYPLTFAIARRAARIDGESKRRGVVIPFQERRHTVFTVPIYSAQAANKSEFRFYESDTDQPPTLHTWFYPGDTTGFEFRAGHGAAPRSDRAAADSASIITASN